MKRGWNWIACFGSLALSAFACHAPENDGPHRRRPRILPVERDEWTDAQRDYLEPHEKAGRLFNLFKTAARHPELANSVEALAFGHVMGPSSTLPPRHRELLILRTAWLCGCEYQWAQHAVLARDIGLIEDELSRIILGPEAPGWSPLESTLLRVADELHRDTFVSDATWEVLSTTYQTQQLMDAVATVGMYTLASMSINSWGVELDPGLSGFPSPREVREPR